MFVCEIFYSHITKILPYLLLHYIIIIITTKSLLDQYHNVNKGQDINWQRD